VCDGRRWPSNTYLLFRSPGLKITQLFVLSVLLAQRVPLRTGAMAARTSSTTPCFSKHAHLPWRAGGRAPSTIICAAPPTAEPHRPTHTRPAAVEPRSPPPSRVPPGGLCISLLATARAPHGRTTKRSHPRRPSGAAEARIKGGLLLPALVQPEAVVVQAAEGTRCDSALPSSRALVVRATKRSTQRRRAGQHRTDQPAKACSASGHLPLELTSLCKASRSVSHSVSRICMWGRGMRAGGSHALGALHDRHPATTHTRPRGGQPSRQTKLTKPPPRPPPPCPACTGSPTSPGSPSRSGRGVPWRPWRRGTHTLSMPDGMSVRPPATLSHRRE
jgi:hypothetical protein